MYLNAFFDLDFERDVNKFVPINRSQCFAYARDYEFNYVQTEDLWYYICRMDKPYLEYRRRTAPKPPKEGRTGAKVAPRRKGK